MFKKSITAAEFAAFTGNDAWKQNLYKKEGDGYKLAHEVEQDTAAFDAEKAAKEQAETQLSELQTTVANLQQQITTLDNEKKQRNKQNDKRPQDEIITDLEGKLEAANTKIETVKSGLEGQLKDALKRGAAMEIASNFTTDLILPEIMARMDIDLTDGKNKLIIMKDGKASSMTAEDLKKELLANPKHKPIIKASDASGGGAGLNGLPANGDGTPKAFKDMTEGERVALHKSNPTEFARLSAEHRAAVGVA